MALTVLFVPSSLGCPGRAQAAAGARVVGLSFGGVGGKRDREGCRGWPLRNKDTDPDTWRESGGETRYRAGTPSPGGSGGEVVGGFGRLGTLAGGNGPKVKDG